MRALAYLRVSTSDQAESGAGLGAQLDACRGWAGRNGAELVATFEDAGVSGAAPIERRPALMDAVAEVGKGDVLLVAKRDRLGRDTFVVALIEAAVGRAGGRVVSAAGEGTDSDGPADMLMRKIIDAFAEYERLVIRARTRAAMRAKAARGERMGVVKYGSRVATGGKLLEPDETELAVVARIRAEADAGAGLREIARGLDASGIPTRTGRAGWKHQTVRLILLRDLAANPHPHPEGPPCLRPRPRRPKPPAPPSPAASPPRSARKFATRA